MLVRRAVWWLIRFYQLTFSAFLGRNCRFEPSCSHYMQEAVMRFGVFNGLILGVKRLARCHPWGGQGFDPVPENRYHLGQMCKCHNHPERSASARSSTSVPSTKKGPRL